MRSCRMSYSSSILVLTALCGLLLAGCGSGGSVQGPTDPGLAFDKVATHAYGDAAFSVNATSASTALISYAVASGPATIAGTMVSVTGIGTVTLSASEPASGGYAAATATTSFSVVAGTPGLRFTVVPAKANTASAFTVSATSPSTGAITYSVTSGPATISGSTVTLTGMGGTVVLGASQAAAGNYTTATATTSFLVQVGWACPASGLLFCGVVTSSATPVVGASVQLYAAGTTGNGSTATALLSGAVSTDVNGNFAIPSSFTCPTASSAIYLLAKGGQVGITGSYNSALWLITPLPPCGSLTTNTSVTLNEISTVATAATLAQFYSTGGNIGATATNAAGLAHAIVTEQVLVDTATGVSPSLSIATNVTVSSAKLNTLANAFTACAVNSASCTALFSAAATTTAPVTTPSNTVDAAFNIARQPGNNATALWTLATGTTFTPVLSDPPPDWMTYITVTGGGMNEPTAIAVDSYGNVWSANYNEVLSEFEPGGTPVFANGITGSGLHESYGMAIDGANNVWVENDETPGSPYNGGTVSKFSNAGVAISSGIGYTAGIYFPTGIASDPNGNMWIANYGNSTYALYANAGTQITTNCNSKGCGYGSLEFPVAVAADNNHVGWIANQSSNTVTRVSADGSTVTPITCCSGASGLAVDAGGYVWVANYFGDSISELSSTGTVVSRGYTGSGIVHPQGIAVDGGGTVWVANYRGNSFSELAGSATTTPGAGFSPSIGFGSDAGMVEPYALAIDASGNVWISNQALNSLTEFVGVAVPVKTPLVGPPQVP
ncbi:MAG TPA: hypothetical protein VGB94_02995 [Acidobacteriaceae bacterium]